MQASAVSIVLLIGLVAPAQTSTKHLRTERQATRACDPASESCVLLTSCPELQALLRPPSSANIRRLQASRCGTKNDRAQVCCPVGPPTSQGSDEPPPTPPGSSKPTSLGSEESLLPTKCGHSLPGDKIHGGTPADLGAYPWMAVLGFQSGSDPAVKWNCGGSLINERYVLTAAHCLRRADQNLSVIRLGENDLESDKDCKGSGVSLICATAVQDFSPEEVVVHPDYEKRGFLSDDVALIRLDRPAVTSPFIQPVCLPEPEDTFEGLVGARTPTVIGFGVTEFGRQSLQLLQVFLPVVAYGECRTTANYATTLVRGKGQACLGGQFQQDACMKDSGGPAMVTRSEHGPPFVQVAIISYGNKFCGLKAVPSVYSDVTFYRRWIVDNLKP